MKHGAIQTRWVKKRCLLLTIFLCALLGGSTYAEAAQAGEPKAKGDLSSLRADLALVPSNAVTFLHIRPAEVWNSPIGKYFRQQYPKQAEGLYVNLQEGLDLDIVNVEAVTLVSMKVESLYRPLDFLVDWPNRAIQAVKLPEAPQEPAVPGEHEDGFSTPADLMIISRTRRSNREKVLKANGAKVKNYKDKTYYVTSKKLLGYSAFYLVNDKLHVYASSEKHMQQMFDQTRKAGKDRTLAPALELAAKQYPLVIGFDLPHKEVKALIKVRTDKDEVFTLPSDPEARKEANDIYRVLQQPIKTKPLQDKVKLRQALDYFSDYFKGKLTFVVDKVAFAAVLGADAADNIYDEEVQLPPAPDVMTMGIALRLVLSQVGKGEATYLIRRNMIEITTVKSYTLGALEPLLQARALEPLLEARTVAIAITGFQEKGEVLAHLEFPDAKGATNAVEAAQDALTLIRIFGLGNLKAEKRNDLEEADSPEQRQAEAFWVLAIKQAESMLRHAKVEEQKARVNATAEIRFDGDKLRTDAKTLAKELAVDETFRLVRQYRKSSNNLKEIGLALHSYHDANKQFPAVAVCSQKDGKPLLSWRVLILPYIDQQQLYEKFKLDEPWDSPNNIELLPLMPKVFAPVGFKTKDPYTTFYQVFTGPGAAFELRLDKEPALRLKLHQITDGTSNTLAVVEAGEPVPWTKPADIPYDAKKPLPKIGGMFKDGFHALFFDGSVSFLRHPVDQKILRAVITYAGGEPLSFDR